MNTVTLFAPELMRRYVSSTNIETDLNYTKIHELADKFFSETAEIAVVLFDRHTFEWAVTYTVRSGEYEGQLVDVRIRVWSTLTSKNVIEMNRCEGDYSIFHRLFQDFAIMIKDNELTG